MAINYKAAGRIVGSPLCGLDQRMCIEVRQVYDACIRRESGINTILEFTDYTAGTPSVIDGISSCPPVTLTDLTVTAGNNCSQYTMTVNVPLCMTYRNASGQVGTARSVLKYRRNVSLRVPRGTALPFTVEAVAVVASDIASFTAAGVNFTYCIMDVIKVIVPADILVPTYGYAVYPDCTECGRACPGITAAPLYPES